VNEHLVVVSSMTVEQAKQIVVAYGAVLGNAGVIADEQELPFSKAAIKQAILMVAPFASSSEARRSLRLAYLGLADFLPGVGAEPILRSRGEENPPVDAEEIATFMKDLEKKLKWLNRSATEAQRLMRELRDAGLLDP
jgi:hypothetical protein